jgi:DNA processing protein
VPGRIDQVASRGCHKLIRDGAKLLTSVEDILEEWKFTGQLDIKMDQPLPTATPTATVEQLAGLGGDAERVYAQLAGGRLTHPDELAAETDLPSARISAALLLLELKRLVVKRADGRFEAR